MSPRLCAMMVLAMLLGAIPAGATQLSLPQVEYSADSVTQTEDMTLERHIFYTPTKERTEAPGQGTTTEAGPAPIQILRRDSKVMWQLMPSEKMYMEMKLDRADPKDMSRWDFEETVVGHEELNGMKVTKYKTIATSSDGKKYGGFSWRTKEGVPIKVDLLYKEGTETHRMTTELRNVKIGKQDPKLFEIPPGYTKMDLGGMMGGMMGRETMGQRGVNRPGRGAPPEEAPANPEPPSGDQSDMQKATDMMKKLFGQ
ncbi:MAG: DUF4412 domain-containing protein [Nitrospiraceae bacterium]